MNDARCAVRSVLGAKTQWQVAGPAIQEACTPGIARAGRVDDVIDDGDVGYTITTGDPSSTDPTYDALTAGDVADVTGLLPKVTFFAGDEGVGCRCDKGVLA